MTSTTRREAPSRGRRRLHQRRIGPAGTAGRAVGGITMLGSVTYGHTVGPFRPAPWVLGVVGFPALTLGWQVWRTRRNAPPLQAIGPLPHVLNVAIFFALYLTPDYAPALSVTSDAALVFYGLSMLLAAARGYAGCEVLALSNWLLRRDDQVGCLLFAPIDHLEHGRRGGR